MVKLTKIGLTVQYTTNSLRLRQLIESSLKFYNEDAVFTRAYQDHGWDGYTRFYDKRKLCFDFGFLPLIINVLEEHDVKWELSGIDVDTFQPVSEINPKLWEHQKESIVKFFEVKHGILKIPTRGGKTFVTSEMFRLVREVHKDFVFLFIVDSQDLFAQATSDIAKYLKIKPSEIGKIQGENFEIKKINVATIQTLISISESLNNIRKYKFVGKGKSIKVSKTLEELRLERKAKKAKIQELDNFLESVNFLVVDECHEQTSTKRIELIKQANHADFYLFLSAEPYKSEDKMANLRLQSIAGEIFYDIPEKTLKERGVLANDKVLLIMMDYKNMKINNDARYLDQHKQVIVANPLRNSVLTNVIELCRKLHLKTLVLFTSVEHGHYIKSITKDPFISGVNNLEDRTFVKKTFLRGRGKVLLASNIFKKGITLPEVEVLLNAGGGLEKANVVQKKGRVLGATDSKKKALIIDLIDISGKYFESHSLNRIEVYESQIGTENIVVMDASDPDFYNDVSEFISSWFN